MSDYKNDKKTKIMLANLRQILYNMEVTDLNLKLDEKELFEILFNYHLEEVLQPTEIINLAFRCEKLNCEVLWNYEMISYVDRLIKANSYTNEKNIQILLDVIQNNKNEKNKIINNWLKLKELADSPVSSINQELILKICNYLMNNCQLYIASNHLIKITKKYPELSKIINSYLFFQTLSNRAESKTIDTEKNNNL